MIPYLAYFPTLLRIHTRKNNSIDGFRNYVSSASIHPVHVGIVDKNAEIAQFKTVILCLNDQCWPFLDLTSRQ